MIFIISYVLSDNKTRALIRKKHITVSSRADQTDDLNWYVGSATPQMANSLRSKPRRRARATQKVEGENGYGIYMEKSRYR